LVLCGKVVISNQQAGLYLAVELAGGFVLCVVLAILSALPSFATSYLPMIDDMTEHETSDYFSLPKDPFQRLTPTETSLTARLTIGCAQREQADASLIGADSVIPKSSPHILASIPLEQIDLKGTIAYGSRLVALLKPPNEPMVSASIGHYLGTNKGQVVAIESERLRLKVESLSQDGCWRSDLIDLKLSTQNK
jgi:hypothetical protein